MPMQWQVSAPVRPPPLTVAYTSKPPSVSVTCSQQQAGPFESIFSPEVHNALRATALRSTALCLTQCAGQLN